MTTRAAETGVEDSKNTVLEVQDLAVRFDLGDQTVRPVNYNSFDLKEGETLGLVGESGSGKSVTARAIMGLIESPGVIHAGSIMYKGQNLIDCSSKEIRKIRGRQISMVFQDPLGSLNPVFTIGEQLERVLFLNRGMKRTSKVFRWLSKVPGMDVGLSEIEEHAAKLLQKVGIPDSVERLDEYPHQLSGGQQQRVLIAMAIAADPEILIADEPTTALDVTIEAQIFELLDELQEELGMSLLLITHDLSVIADIADRVMIMYAGNIVEKTSVNEIFDYPLHPYTKALLNLIPRTDEDINELEPIGGEVPDLSNVPPGCPFHTRCPEVVEDCSKIEPDLMEVREAHHAACIEVEGYNYEN